MRPKSSPTGPDPAVLAAIQAQTESEIRAAVEVLRAGIEPAVPPPEDAPAPRFADLLRDLGALRDRVEHDQRMARLGRPAARDLGREIGRLGRIVRDRRRDHAREREERREAADAAFVGLIGAAADFAGAVDAYDPLEKSRAKADAVRDARLRFDQLLREAGDVRRAPAEAMRKFNDARRRLDRKYRERAGAAADNEAWIEGILLAFRAAVAEAVPSADREVVRHASIVRRKVLDAFRDRMLPRDVRDRLQTLYEPLDRRLAEIAHARHEAWLERKAAREVAQREYEAAEARFLHYVAVYCGMVYAYDADGGAKRGEAALIREARRPIDEMLRRRMCRPSRVAGALDAARDASRTFEEILDRRHRRWLERYGPRPAPAAGPVPETAAVAEEENVAEEMAELGPAVPLPETAGDEPDTESPDPPAHADPADLPPGGGA
jgi:hypothetical protein